MASNGKITVVNIQDRELKKHFLITKHNSQDSNSWNFTIKIENFTPDLGDTGKPIIYYFNSGAGNDHTKLKW
jgi:hypothetical protein